ncbi:MAG: hypothetical protein KME54_23325 [Tolypothrix brevis GSE-NOS-MK-07-07A]|jgi:hypothetical protein|nr:hypothetical protein [Tolypothrix brevis GSE-NOS-MK-07-07A]
MLTREDFEPCIQELESFYNGSVLNGGILEAAWYNTLKHLSLGQLQGAIARCFKKHPRAYNFFPSCGQILEFAQGEYRPPGESAIGDFTLPALPSREQRLTPEQIAESHKRGVLMAQIILSATGYMSVEEKDELIEKLKAKETYELEAITSTSAKVPRKTRKFNNLGSATKDLERELNMPNSSDDFEFGETKTPSYDAKALARQWLEECPYDPAY